MSKQTINFKNDYLEYTGTIIEIKTPIMNGIEYLFIKFRDYEIRVNKISDLPKNIMMGDKVSLKIEIVIKEGKIYFNAVDKIKLYENLSDKKNLCNLIISNIKNLLKYWNG
jgi:hypothetical protein